jgi:hypothetical protein
MAYLPQRAQRSPREKEDPNSDKRDERGIDF